MPEHTFHSICKSFKLLLVIAAILFGQVELHAQSDNSLKIQFEYVSSSLSGLSFKNAIVESVDRNISDYDYFYNGGGVAIGDLNNDGLPDLVLTGNDSPNEVYINEGKLTYRKLNQPFKLNKQKWATGVTLVDINTDGLLDIYISYSGPDYESVSTRNELYINLGDETFSEQSKEYGVDDNSLSTQSVFFDMDRDGDLDLWVMNHSVRNLKNNVPDYIGMMQSLPDSLQKRFGSTLYENSGLGIFKDVTKEAGVDGFAFGLGISVADFNGDGWQDVFIANDFFLPDKLYVNQKDGSFKDEIKSKMAHTTFYSMGCDAADINNDGWTDLAVLDMTPSDHYRSKMMMNAMSVNDFRFLTERLNYLPQYMFNGLHINTSKGVMSDIGLLAGVSQSDWSWAPLLADFNNDGNKDLFISNGFFRDTKNNDWRAELLSLVKAGGFNDEKYFQHLLNTDQTPLLNEFYQNMNGFQFEDQTSVVGLTQASFSNGAAYGDLDLDGDLDLVVNNLNQEAFLCKNLCVENGGGNYIQVKLKSGLSLDGYKLSIKYGEEEQHLDYSFTRGFQSSVEPLAHFGIAQSSRIDTLFIHSPSGQNCAIVNPEINKLHLIDIDHLIQVKASEHEHNTQFSNVTNEKVFPPFYHKENYYDDFKTEILLPHKQSANGPGLAVADINGDGLEDFFIGGAKGQRSAIYLQSDEGVFQKTRSDFFKLSRHHEVQGALLFDCDNDTDLDLYLACGGGGDFKEDKHLLQDLLFINDGTGEFTLSKGLPEMLTSSQSVQANDWDKDGDLDLFVGGRTSPGQYPVSPDSYMLENDNGMFKDISDSIAPGVKGLGMVTDAEWFDWEDDGDMDLVIVGEWMPISVFVNKKGEFKKSTPVENSSGWWNCIESGDLDNDNDLDLILGNIGLNNKFHPSKEKPLYLFANDFDANGTLDIVLSKVYKETLYPVRGKECSSMQMPNLQGSHPTFNEFASSNLFEIYGQEKLDSSYQFQVEVFESMVLRNKGGGQYSTIQLPIEAQISSINDVVLSDFDNDGIQDILIAGNNSQTEAETTPYDAGKGLMLTGNGDCTFTTDILTISTGVFLPGDVRQMDFVSIKNEEVQAIIVAKNNTRLNIILPKK